MDYGKIRSGVWFLALIIIVTTAATAQAVPPLANYQGRLLDGSGQPVTGSVPMTFALWDGETTGTMLWSESKAVAVNQGLYQVLLGDSTGLPASVFSGSTVFLEVTVMGETLTPRERMTAVPYAFSADDAASLGGVAASGYSLVGHTHDFSELTGTASDAQIPDNITVNLAQNTTQFNGLAPDAYVLSAGDTVTGDLQVNGTIGGNPDLTVADNLHVTGSHVGIGVSPNTNYAIINSSGASPNGALLWGTNSGVIGNNSTDSANYALLGTSSAGVNANAGSYVSTGNRFGGFFYAETQNNAYGIYTQAYGDGSGSAYGVAGYGSAGGAADSYGGSFMTDSSGTGSHYGVYGSASGSTAEVYGVKGYASNGSNKTAYGGYFSTASSGSLYNYGVYGTSDGSAVYGAWAGDPYNNYGTMGTSQAGVYGRAGNSGATLDMSGGGFQAYSQNWAYGVNTEGVGYGSNPAYGVYAIGYAYGSGNAYGAYLYGTGSGGGSYYGMYVAAGVKSWVNPDPDDPDQAIVYSTVESGQNVTYFAGVAHLEKGHAVVELPDHFRKVTSPDRPLVVQLTPESIASRGLAIISKSNAEIEVGELDGGTGTYDFDYTVKGIRLGYEDFQPLIANEDYVPFQGNLSGLDSSRMTTQEFYDRQPPGLKKIFEQNGTLDHSGKVNEAAFEARGWKDVKTHTSPAPRQGGGRQ